MNSFSHPLWFIPINRLRTACSYCTEATASCTDISKYHECGSACSPAFAHIGTVPAFTDRMKLMCINKTSYMLIFFANGKLYTKPIWFLLPGFRYYWEFCHEFFKCSMLNYQCSIFNLEISIVEY